MRYILLLITFFAANQTKAQEFSFSLKGGINNTHPRIISTQLYNDHTFSDNYGWQAAAGAEYETGFKFYIYTGAGFAQRGYQDYIERFDTLFTTTYRPLFVNIPFGIGYKKKLNEKYNLRLFGGTNVQLGVGGKIKTEEAFYFSTDPENGQFELRTTDVSSRKIKFGDRNKKTIGYDYAIANWGFQMGTALELTRVAELEFIFDLGLNNILPGKKYTSEIQKMNIMELNLKIDFPNDYLNKHAKK